MHTQLDLDQLVHDYWENLNVNLRGFTPAQGHEFLNAWVPSDAPTDSLLDLIDLGREAGLHGLTVTVSPATFAQLDMPRLQSNVDTPVGVQEEAGRVTLAITLRAGGELAIHASYQKGILAELEHVTHERFIALQDQCALVSACRDGITVSALVDRGRTVALAGFQGAVSPVQRGLMECLCRMMEGKPIQECADHALIFVEQALRDPEEPPPVPGLVTPDNADPAFALPQQLIRDLLACYREQTKYEETKNFFDRRPGEAWTKMTEKERREAIQKEMEALQVTGQLELAGIDGSKRVVVRTHSSLASPDAQQLIVRLETHLRQAVEPTIHVVNQIKSDANILRMPGRSATDGPSTS